MKTTTTTELTIFRLRYQKKWWGKGHFYWGVGSNYGTHVHDEKKIVNYVWSVYTYTVILDMFMLCIDIEVCRCMREFANAFNHGRFWQYNYTTTDVPFTGDSPRYKIWIWSV